MTQQKKAYNDLLTKFMDDIDKLDVKYKTRTEIVSFIRQIDNTWNAGLSAK